MSDGFISFGLALIVGSIMYGTGAPTWAGAAIVMICLLLFWVAVLIRNIKQFIESQAQKRGPDFYTPDSKEHVVAKLESLGFQRLK